MAETRRGFLKQLGLTTLGAGVAIPLLEALRPGARAAAAVPAGAAVKAGRQWGMVVDVEKLLRDDVRRACVDACHREHNVPDIPDPEEQVAWIRTETYERLFEDQLHAHVPAVTREAPVLALCNHCTEPACIKVCPTGATWKREEDGIVMMDMHRCIGCRYCMAACPFGARSFNWGDPRPFVRHDASGKPLSDFPTRTKGVVEKCTFCAERIRTGREPACVEAANAVPGGEGALVFGDVNDPGSEVSRILGQRSAMLRRPSLGTGPNVYYLVPEAFPAITSALAAGEGTSDAGSDSGREG
jgi:[DsrC]-trisulfide reductase subunit O